MDNQNNNIEENVTINSLYLIMILNQYGKATLEELAIAFYLFRFTNIFVGILDKRTQENYLKLCSPSDIDNLDSLLSSYLVNIYSERFQRSLSELLARNMVRNDANDNFCMNFDNKMLDDLINELELRLINERVKIIVRYIENNEISVVKQKIYNYAEELKE